MFTGIVEAQGELLSTSKSGENLRMVFRTPFEEPLKIDQSLAHNGACLTVVDIDGDHYTIDAIPETLQRTNLGSLSPGDEVNLERCVAVGGRLDGHIVQGHVDCQARCTNVEVLDGSHKFWFEHPDDKNFITVEKGSVCVNGVSLTVVDSTKNSFSVAIIPYTFEHTNFKAIKIGDLVNIEFDIIGKYITKMKTY